MRTNEEQDQDEKRKQEELAAARDEHNRRVNDFKQPEDIPEGKTVMGTDGAEETVESD